MTDDTFDTTQPDTAPVQVAGSTSHNEEQQARDKASTFAPMMVLVRRLPRYARLSAALARDPEVPASAKAMLVVGGAYLVSPIDLVPGIIPVAGQLDDLYVVLTGLQQAMRVTPAPVVARHFAAVDLPQECVNEDLASIRQFVRSGIVWGVRQGGRAMGQLSRQTMNVLARAQSWKEARNDQKSL
jgi:uncharacterized membrane protein YkvA (DUF1232 family)